MNSTYDDGELFYDIDLSDNAGHNPNGNQANNQNPNSFNSNLNNNYIAIKNEDNYNIPLKNKFNNKVEPSYLILNEPDNVLVDLPPGKISSQGYRKAIKGQKGNTCLSSGLRRISIYSKDIKNHEIYKVIKEIKKYLENNNCNENLLTMMINTCNRLNIDYTNHICVEKKNIIHQWYSNKKISNEQFFLERPPIEKIFILYDILIKEFYKDYCDAVETNWKPEYGPQVLMDTLRNNGVLVVIGKFGMSYHKATSSFHDDKDKENSSNRYICAFSPNSYIGDRDDMTWSHCVIIDQVKKIHGEYFVYFIDPWYESIPGEQQAVFKLNYTDFVSRICEFDTGIPQNYFQNWSANFGLHSKHPLKLASLQHNQVINYNNHNQLNTSNEINFHQVQNHAAEEDSRYRLQLFSPVRNNINNCPPNSENMNNHSQQHRSNRNSPSNQEDDILYNPTILFM